MKNIDLIKNTTKIIELRAINENWSITFTQDCKKKPHILQQTPRQLLFIADHKKVNCKPYIETWLKKYAKKYLPPWLDNVSQQTGLKYQRISIRGQRTRWGSCSEQQSISLNYKLLFLPQRLVEHLLLHELCHTVHLDHSNQFWQLLASFDKHWYEKKLHCQKAHHYVPSWLDE